MDRMIYLSMSGAKATMQRQDALASNLANVSTAGLSRRAARRSARCRCTAAAPAPASTRSRRRPATTPRRARSPTTGRNLDVAVKGNGWLTVQALDGTEAYTRGGGMRGRRATAR